MSTQYKVTFDENGDLWVAGGWVVSLASGTRLRVGTAPNAPGPMVAPGRLDAEGSAQEIYLGGSGRNLILSGFPGDGPNGVWRHGYWRQWGRAGYRLTLAGDGSVAISDGIDIVAELATGGPAGTYASTAYGETVFGGIFIATVTTEPGWPGTVTPLAVSISAGFAMGGKYTAVDSAHWTSDGDADWTVFLAEDGSAELSRTGAPMAARTEGTNLEAAGVYDSTEAGADLNPLFTDEPDEEEPAEENPFGILTLVYSWSGSPDLDTTTRFLDGDVGYPPPDSAAYMTFTGDETSTGEETVTIDLAAAWEDGEITTFADITCLADWYPSGSSGPATLTITNSIGGDPLVITISPGPGPHTPATTQVLALRVLADGTMGQEYGPWTASISRYRVPVPAGTVYLEITETDGALSAVAGPFFATEMPASAGDVFRVPLAESDGLGWVGQIHSGTVFWRDAGGGGGAAFTEITEEDFIDLDPPDSGTYYDITDLLP